MSMLRGLSRGLSEPNEAILSFLPVEDHCLPFHACERGRKGRKEERGGGGGGALQWRGQALDSHNGGILLPISIIQGQTPNR